MCKFHALSGGSRTVGLLRRSLIAALLTTAMVSAARAQTVGDLRFLGQATFATGGPIVDGTLVGGLSGLTYDSANDRFYSVSDDRSQIHPARFYTLTLDFTGGVFDDSRVHFTNATLLRRPDGTTFPALTLDPEGIALVPGGQVFVSSEGDRGLGLQPFVNAFDLTTGQQVQALPIPSKFLVGTAGVGVRNNLAFESLTHTPGGSPVTATENALLQDGPAATVANGSSSRILVYTPSGLPAAEYVYGVDPVVGAPMPPDPLATNGLADMAALSETRFLALERSFSLTAGFNIRLFEVSLEGATDVSGLDSLAGQSFTPVMKRLLLDVGTLGIALDNIEGLAFGPDLGSGERALILVSDNNFNSFQVTQFLAFGVTVVPEPTVTAFLGAFALAGLLVLRRRRAR